MADSIETENPEEHNLTAEQAESIETHFQLRPSEFRGLKEVLQKAILQHIELEDRPRLRALQFMESRIGSNGEIPPDAYTKAAEQLMAALEATPSLRGRTGGLPGGSSIGPVAPMLEELALEAPTAGLTPDNTGWKSLGPGNIGGRIRSIQIDPTNTQKMYIGSVGGGVWNTSDGGASWQPADDLMANLAVCSMAMDPTDSSVIYAGTGEGYANIDAIQGAGIFKTDDGWVWQQLASTKPSPTNRDFLWVNGLTISNDGNTILAGTSTGIFKSVDAGVSWSKKLTANVGNIQFDPSDGTKAVAGLLWGGGSYYSTNGGDTWSVATYPPGAAFSGRIQVCYAVADTNTVYASVDVRKTVSHIWISTDGGATYATRSTGNNYLGKQGWYANTIWAGDPTNKNFVVVGGLDLWKSTDGGNALTQISQWWRAPQSAHADQQIIHSDPNYNGVGNKTVFFGNDGGIYKAGDVSSVGTNPTFTNGWTNLNNKLQITQYYGGAGKFTITAGVTTVNSVVGGAQDNGTTRYLPSNGANNWNTWNGGDGGACASDPSSANNYYGEYTSLQIFRSTNGGTSADYICGRYYNGTQWVWKPAPYTIGDAQDGSAPFISAFVIDPNNASRILGGGMSLWRTDDPLTVNTATTGPSWAVVKPSTGSAISSIAVAPGNSDLVLVGHANGQIFKSTNATSVTPDWALAATGINANRKCTGLAIDKNDNTRFYATFGGFQSGNVWTSSNSGTSWSDISGVLPSAPIFCVAIHPQNSEWIYVATETGVFASEDRGTNWTPTNSGPTNCLAYQLFWLGNTMVCATHGRGMFAIDLTIKDQASLILAGDMAGNLTSYNAANGSQVSTYAMASGQITAAPVVDALTVYCGYEQPFKVAKFNDANNLATGPTWETVLGGSVNATPNLVKGIYPGDADLLYVAAADGKLYVLNAADGTQVWSLQVVPTALVGTGVNAYSNIIMNDWVYIATDKGLYAVNSITKDLGWSKDYICKAPPLLAADTVYAPTVSGHVYSVQSRTGEVNWDYNAGNAVGSTPVWILGTVIAGNQSGALVGLDYKSGALQFQENFSGEQIQAITADGDQLFFAGNAVNGHLYNYRMNINGATRNLTSLWSTPMALGAARPPQVVGTSLYLTTTDTKLQAFNTDTGAKIWQESLPRIALAAPTPVFA